MPETPIAVRRALVSLSDKTGLEGLARALNDLGIEIVSTGGTARAIANAGIGVTDVASVTGFPEILDGRVKTLHPSIHGGLLADRGNAAHMHALDVHAIAGIDLLVVNLYPFEATVVAGAATPDVIENIDIGGPAMIRAAAKNHESVAVVVDPADYAAVIDELRGGGISVATRRLLAARAYARTAAYDTSVADWMARYAGDETPRHASVAGALGSALRYGENPHQKAAFYRTGDRREGVATARQVQGKALSYNNLLDTDAAFELIAEFAPADQAAVAVIKHANPCGVALGDTLAEAHAAALRTDPVSAYGGIVAFNRPLDAAAAQAVVEIFTEVIIAPGASEDAISIVRARPNLRLLLTDGLPDPAAPGRTVRSVAGGLLVQTRDNAVAGPAALTVVTKRAPTAAEMADLIFAWRIAKHVKSNAIVYARNRATAGIGAGQMSRVDSARIAARKAADAALAAGFDAPLTKGSVVASDAFFPFADGLLSAAEAGATAVIQPGGSLRDADVIAAADDAGLAMVFTGTRHFRH